MVKISENKQTKKTQIVLLKKYKDQLNKLKDVQHHNHQVNTHQNYSKMQFHILTNCWFKPWKSQMLAEMWRGLFKLVNVSQQSHGRSLRSSTLFLDYSTSRQRWLMLVMSTPRKRRRKSSQDELWREMHRESNRTQQQQRYP